MEASQHPVYVAVLRPDVLKSTNLRYTVIVQVSARRWSAARLWRCPLLVLPASFPSLLAQTENRYFDSGNIHVKRRFNHFKWLQRRLGTRQPLPADLTSTLEYVGEREPPSSRAGAPWRDLVFLLIVLPSLQPHRD